MNAQFTKKSSIKKLPTTTIQSFNLNLYKVGNFVGSFSNYVKKNLKKMQPFSILKKYLTCGALTICSLSFYQTSTEAVTVNDWSGRWQCGALRLTIIGNGRESQISGYYPKAHAGKPAQEVYTIESIWPNGAMGHYTYHDRNPNRGPKGTPGVWTGTWRIETEGNLLRLYRWDDASGWKGEYVCK